jgi:tRNA nucleotidyltransferase (CCA-adding enzyme)
MLSSASLPSTVTDRLIERCHEVVAALRTIPCSSPCELYLVGGAVRDALSGLPIQDIDLATNLRPEAVRDILVGSGIRVYETGLHHGTVTALSSTGEPIEITTFRLPNPANLPLFSDSLVTDLSGRDFTINAIALNLFTLEVIDPYSGRQDIASGTIRLVGEDELRFIEDPLRILRMVRFGTASAREITPHTLEAAERHAPELSRISIERIRDEFTKILLSDFPKESLRQLRSLGILQSILPEIVPSFDCAQNRWHVEDVFEHTLSVISRAPADDRILRLTALFHDLGKPGTLSVDEAGERHFYAHELLSTTLCQEAMRRLKYSNEEIHDVSLLVRNHMRPIDCGVPGVRRLLRDLGPHFARFRRFQDADKTPILSDDSHRARTERFDALVSAELARLAGTPVDKLTINGDDLIKLGLSPGPIIGKILKTLGEAVLDTPEINTPELLLAMARSLIEQDPTLTKTIP